MVTSYMLELSKTNYIYIPLLTKDDRQAQEMYRNLMTGEKKRKYYTEVINMRRTIQEHIFREIYGDEYTNKLLGEKSDK